MNVALLVIGDGRADYLEATCQSIARHAGWVDHALMIDDSGDRFHELHVDCNYPDYTIRHGGRRGMAGAVQAGFDLVLSTPATHVLWIEEDMMLTRDLPVRQATHTLDANPALAQMCFRREPWWGSPDEQREHDQLAAICSLAPNWYTKDTYTVHDYIFSLNPCVIPRRILEHGWDSDNEAGMTAKLLTLGYLFGSWGTPDVHQSWAQHIGDARSVGWRL